VKTQKLENTLFTLGSEYTLIIESMSLWFYKGRWIHL